MLEQLRKIKEIYIFGFILVLGNLEYYNIHLQLDKAFETFNTILQTTVAFITFFVVIAFFRIERLPSTPAGSDKKEDIINNFSKYGIRTVWVMFVYLFFLFLSTSNKADILGWHLQINLDKVILSFLIISTTYVFDGIRSSLLKENLKV